VGNVLDLQGAYDEAFRYYREANELQLSLLKRREMAFNARAHQDLIDKLRADHEQAYFEKVKGWGIPTELPVFIVGLPYSGAALVEDILAGHPKVTRMDEKGSVVRFLLRSATDRSPATTTAQLLPDMGATRMAAANYLQHLTQLGQGAARVLVNSFDNVMGLGLIGTLFPGARVIHCRRRPLDAGLACYFQYRRDLAFSCSLTDIAAFFLAHEKLMAHWERVLPLRIHQVNYEELIQNREESARALLSYCGLEWDEHFASGTTATGNEEPASSDPRHVSNPLDRIGHSEHYLTHLGALIKGLEHL
jgi:hypothetical protein